MIVVTSRPSGTRIDLVCCYCHRSLTWAEAWLAFPADADGVEGKWVHGNCASGRLRDLFGTRRTVLMRGDAAFSRLATSLMVKTTV
jgi:hypothetical protein